MTPAARRSSVEPPQRLGRPQPRGAHGAGRPGEQRRAEREPTASASSEPSTGACSGISARGGGPAPPPSSEPSEIFDATVASSGGTSSATSAAAAKPSAIPISAPSTPIAADSPRTSATTRVRDQPSARSEPSSRVRFATPASTSSAATTTAAASATIASSSPSRSESLPAPTIEPSTVAEIGRRGGDDARREALDAVARGGHVGRLAGPDQQEVDAVLAIGEALEHRQVEVDVGRLAADRRAREADDPDALAVERERAPGAKLARAA